MKDIIVRVQLNDGQEHCWKSLSRVSCGPGESFPKFDTGFLLKK